MIKTDSHPIESMQACP